MNTPMIDVYLLASTLNKLVIRTKWRCSYISQNELAKDDKN